MPGKSKGKTNFESDKDLDNYSLRNTKAPASALLAFHTQREICYIYAQISMVQARRTAGGTDGKVDVVVLGHNRMRSGPGLGVGRVGPGNKRGPACATGRGKSPAMRKQVVNWGVAFEAEALLFEIIESPEKRVGKTGLGMYNWRTRKWWEGCCS